MEGAIPARLAADIAVAVALAVDFVGSGLAVVDIGDSGPVLGFENGFELYAVLRTRAVMEVDSDGDECFGAVH